MTKKEKATAQNNPHDQFFRGVLQSLAIAKEFLKTHLPTSLVESVDWQNLTIQPRAFLSELKNDLIADLVFKTKFNDEDGYIWLLIEHQSTPDKLMPFRILKYTCEIINNHLREHKNNQIPLVYPLVVYQGKRAYPYSTDIKSLVDAPKELVDKYFLGPFQLIDLPSISDNELRTETWSGIVAFTMKHIFARDIFPKLKEILQMIGNKDEHNEKVGLDVIDYVVNQGNLGDFEQLPKLIEAVLPEPIKGDAMTIAECLKEKGRKEGLIIGRNEGITQGITQGIADGRAEGRIQAQQQIAIKLLKELSGDITTVERITGLSRQQVIALKSNADLTKA